MIHTACPRFKTLGWLVNTHMICCFRPSPHLASLESTLCTSVFLLFGFPLWHSPPLQAPSPRCRQPVPWEPAVRKFSPTPPPQYGGRRAWRGGEGGLGGVGLPGRVGGGGSGGGG